MSDVTRAEPKRLRVLMRDYRMLEAGITMPESQSLTSFLAGRKNYLVLHDVHWLATGERQDTAAVRVDRVLWLAVIDEDLELTNSRITAEPRSVGMLLDGGVELAGGVVLGQLQRIGDYLESAGPFVAVRAGVITRGGRPQERVQLTVGDLAVNQDAIQAAWEVVGGEDVSAPSEGEFPAVTVEDRGMDEWGAEAASLDWEHDEDDGVVETEDGRLVPSLRDPVFGMAADESADEEEPNEQRTPDSEGWV